MPLTFVPMWVMAAGPVAAQQSPMMGASVTGASLLVWPFFPGSADVASSAAAADQANLGVTVADDVAGFLASDTQWQVSAFHADDAYVKQTLAAAAARGVLPGGNTGGMPVPGGATAGGAIPAPGGTDSGTLPTPGTVNPPETGPGFTTAGGTAGATTGGLPAPGGATTGTDTGTTPAPPDLPPAAPAAPAPPVPQLQQVATPENPGFNPAPAGGITNVLGFHFMLIGTIDSLTYNAATHSSTAQISATVYDTSVAGFYKVAAAPFFARGRSYGLQAQLTAAQAETLALQEAARQLSTKVARSGIIPLSLSQPRGQQHTGGGHKSSMAWLIPVIAVIAIGAFALSRGGGGSNNNNNNNVTSPNGGSSTLAPPRNAIATLTNVGSAFPVDLTFTASASGLNVRQYQVRRVGGGQNTIIDTIDASGGLSTFVFADSGLVPGQKYTYSVQAVGFNGQTSAATPFVTPTGSTLIIPGRPAPPSNVMVASITTGPGGSPQVNIAWQPSSDSFVGGYQVSRS
ncbi:MAG: hypothetical protein M3Y56_02595, partial [Armatimonadota bacterium]|nr:hypothetical protein [Armatimonadota bacterium]